MEAKSSFALKLKVSFRIHYIAARAVFPFCLHAYEAYNQASTSLNLSILRGKVLITLMYPVRANQLLTNVYARLSTTKALREARLMRITM